MPFKNKTQEEIKEYNRNRKRLEKARKEEQAKKLERKARKKEYDRLRNQRKAQEKMATPSRPTNSSDSFMSPPPTTTKNSAETPFTPASHVRSDSYIEMVLQSKDFTKEEKMKILKDHQFTQACEGMHLTTSSVTHQTTMESQREVEKTVLESQRELQQSAFAGRQQAQKTVLESQNANTSAISKRLFGDDPSTGTSIPVGTSTSTSTSSGLKTTLFGNSGNGPTSTTTSSSAFGNSGSSFGGSTLFGNSGTGPTSTSTSSSAFGNSGSSFGGSTLFGNSGNDPASTSTSSSVFGNANNSGSPNAFSGSGNTVGTKPFVFGAAENVLPTDNKVAAASRKKYEAPTIVHKINQDGFSVDLTKKAKAIKPLKHVKRGVEAFRNNRKTGASLKARLDIASGINQTKWDGVVSWDRVVSSSERREKAVQKKRKA